jgi:hypothetical protein
MGNFSCFTALSEVTAFNWQLTMFYDPVLRLSSSSEKYTGDRFQCPPEFSGGFLRVPVC